MKQYVQYRQLSSYQCRHLWYLKIIVDLINNNEINLAVLAKSLINWTAENSNQLKERDYTKGLITSTQSASNYIKFAQNIGLIISSSSNTYYNSKYSYLFKTFTNEKIKYSFQLSDKQRLFVLRKLFELDSDILLSILSLFHNNNIGYTLTGLCSVLENNILVRIDYKLNQIIDALTKERMLMIKKGFLKEQRKTSINNLVIHRLDWLIFLGLLEYNNRNKTYYMCDTGNQLLDSMPKMYAIDIGTHFDIIDIDKIWLERNCFKTITPLFITGKKQEWLATSYITKDYITTLLFNDIFNKFCNSKITPRVIDNIGFLYFCICSIIDYEVIIEYNELNELLKTNPIIGDYKYSIAQQNRQQNRYILRSVM